ncbi:MAG TPA: hypothetical protein VFC99_04950 [Acidimicrobiia bacterium]|nr:hypothetical protein [Acidimicrobiia bacterium]
MNDVATIEPEDRVPRLGERTVRRPPPGFGHVLGAAAGAFAVVAVVAFVVEVASNDPTAPGVGFDAALALAALVVGFRAPGPLRAAGVTILVLTAPIIWFFALFGSGGGGRSELRGLYLLTLVTYLVLYVVGWTRGRAILLAGALIFLASWVTFEVAGNNATLVPFENQVSTPFSVPRSSGGTGSTLNDDGTSVTFNNENSNDDAAGAALAIGLAFLGIGALLDRRRFDGSATPFIAVGAIEAIVGAAVLGGRHGALAGGLLAAAAGLVVGVVGAHGRNRRGSTWIGVLTIFGGLVAVLVDIAPSTAAGIGGIAAGFAIGLGVIAVWIAPRLGEADDGGMPSGAPAPAPPPAPPDAVDEEPPPPPA